MLLVGLVVESGFLFFVFQKRIQQFVDDGRIVENAVDIRAPASGIFPIGGEVLGVGGWVLGVG